MHIQIMKALVLFVLVCVGHCSAKHKAENDKREESEAFNTHTEQLGDGEELLTVTAEDGKPLATIDVVFDEGYEIELTPDGSKCRLSKVQDNSSCFEEVPFDEDMLEDNEAASALIADRCKGREIVTLKPTDCDDKSGLNAVKRFWGGKYGSCWYEAYREVCPKSGWFWSKPKGCTVDKYKVYYRC